MGGNSEHFCLRWNDFESNISQAFREIRDEKDFFDVTLACEDEQVQAHKVILSACSPFFRTILRRNRHDHPLLYLKGVKYAEILSILNFMYHGEVNVAQDELNSFLAVAEELRVKGLTQNSQDTSKQQEKTEHQSKMPTPRRVREPPDLPTTTPPVKKARVPTTSHSSEPAASTPVKTEPMSAPDVMEESYQEAPMATQASKHDMVSFEDPNNYDYAGYEEEEPNAAQFDASNSHALRPEGNKGDFRDGLLGHMMARVYKEELASNLWKCTVCQKEHKSKTLIRDHVEAQHFKSIDYSCDHCGKVYKTRDSFKKHVAVHKRNPGFYGRGAYNSSRGEERMQIVGQESSDNCQEDQTGHEDWVPEEAENL